MLSLIFGGLSGLMSSVSSIFSGFFNEKIAGIKADAQVTIAETQVSAQIIHDTNDDIALRVMRDMACFPVVVWMMLMSWDTIVAKHSPHLMWHTPDFPAAVSYIPTVVLVFIFGNIGLNMWKRK